MAHQIRYVDVLATTNVTQNLNADATFGFENTGAASNVGVTLAWWDDFRSNTLTAQGLTDEGGGATMETVSATGLGFPSGINYVVRHTYVAEVSKLYGATNLWPAVTVGNSMYERFYLRQALPNGANTGPDHGFQCNIGDIKWFWRINGGDADSFSLECGRNGANIVEVADAPKNTVLRLERKLTRTGSTTCDAEFRVYNGSTLLGSQTRTGITGMTDALTRQALYGMSGQAGATYNGGYVYWGALAVSLEGWIGSYPTSAEAA